MFFRKCSALLVGVTLLTSLSASALAVDFPDVAPEYWAYSDIQKASDYGLVRGMEDGTFRPSETLNRASFVTILQRMFGWEAVTPERPSFTDVDAGHWAYAAVETARAHGVLEEDALFQPMAYVTREEMAVMLVRALGYDRLAQDLESGGKAGSFPDVTDHAGHIAVAAAIGMTNGIKDDKTGLTYFEPDAFATRDQAAAMLARVYERYISKVDWLHGFYAFASYDQISYTAQMDGVSVGWAQMEFDPATGPWLNSQKTATNDWVKPTDDEIATGYFQGNNTPYNLNVYADTRQLVTLPDGSKTSTLESILGSAEAQAQAVAALTAAVPDYAGITIDFEGLTSDTYKEAFVTFMTALRAALPEGKTLYVCVPTFQWYKGFDYRALGAVCDKVILMAHDFQWTSVPEGYVGTRAPDSPVTPFPDVFQAFRAITDPETGVQDKSKIAVQISFGTAGFEIDENGLLAGKTIYHPAQATIAKRLIQPDTVITYDESDRNPVAIYYGDDGTTRYQLWYEDARSVADKIELARMFGINGISIWRLGNIPSYAEDASVFYNVWEAILDQR